METAEVLHSLGLDQKEIMVYTALLELGEATVLNISRKTTVKRPTAYLVLSSLESKGFVSKVFKGKRVLFAPQHPKKILTEAEIRLKQIKETIPQFEAMMQQTGNRPRVMIYEGKDALDKAFDETFLIKGEVLFMSNMELVQNIFSRTLQKLSYASSPEFRTREVIDDSEISRAYAKQIAGSYRQVRFMPKAFSPFATDIGIFGNTTLITSGKKEYFTVKIESEEIANAFRAMFEAMWQISYESNQTVDKAISS